MSRHRGCVVGYIYNISVGGRSENEISDFSRYAHFFQSLFYDRGNIYAENINDSMC